MECIEHLDKHTKDFLIPVLPYKKSTLSHRSNKSTNMNEIDPDLEDIDKILEAPEEEDLYGQTLQDSPLENLESDGLSRDGEDEVSGELSEDENGDESEDDDFEDNLLY